MLLLVVFFLGNFLLSFIFLLLDNALIVPSLWLSMIISIIVTIISLRAFLLYPDTDSQIFKSNIYKKIISNFIFNLFINLFYTIKLSFSDIKLLVITDTFELEENNWAENVTTCNCLNLNFNILISLVDNKHIKIHSLASDDYNRTKIIDTFKNLDYKIYGKS